MSALTLADLGAPLLALRLFGAEFGHLPAPHLSVSTVYPNRLNLSFHDDLAGFETWRDVLGMQPGAVSYHVQGEGRTRVLEVRAEYAGVELLLTGFAEIPCSTSGDTS
ncbi:hypothetical protein [Streptomyces sp. NPDC096153]|uniref:hypothetical protein n=1 Tax=Streptomyces sp. NPDC096153 TaxID=3155548 RepID=UPI0033287579